MSQEFDPIKQFEVFTKQFKESLTPEQQVLYTSMLSTQTEANKYKQEQLRPQREAEAKAKREQEAAKRKQELDEAAERAAELARKQAEEHAKKQVQQQVDTLTKEKELAVQAAKLENATIKEVVKEVIREVPVTQPVKSIAAPESVKVEPITPTPTQNSILIPKPKVNSRQHYLLPLVVKSLKARCHIWLVGPAGSGKTTLAASAANELGLTHVALSVCGQTTKTDLLGYVDAYGVYRGTCFRQAYEHGGVFCLDEIDNGNANVLAVLNSSLASEYTTFPDKAVQRHENFIVVACANTYGLGATGGYVGRTQVDAATLDRFFFIEMPYDDGLESHVAGIVQESPIWNNDNQNVPSTEEWLSIVRGVRKKVSELNIKTIISPRATYMGIALIKQGISLQYLKKGLLYKSMSQDTIARLD